MKFLIIPILAFFLYGCVSPVLPPREINTTMPFNYKNDKNLKMRVSRDIEKLRPSRVLYVAPVEWKEKKTLFKRERKEIGKFLRNYFYQGLLYENFHEMILTKRKNLEAFKDMGYRINRLEISITHINRGTGIYRYLIGFGLGSSDLQIEGKILDNESGEEIMSFVSRCRHAGNSYNGMNPRSLSGMYCLKMSIEEETIKITDIIKDIWSCSENFGTSKTELILAFER
jgi:uncharacterized protein DUF4410